MGQGAAILGCAGPALSKAESAFYRDFDPWGFILFARNIENPMQLRRLTGDLCEAVERNAPILIDQEGGRVARLCAPHWREWPPPLTDVAAFGASACRGMYLRYRIIAEELRAVGIDVNCAPCADIALTHTHSVLRDRCYGDDSDTVTRISRTVASGLLAGGVLPVIKHMPGQGGATLDSHMELPGISADAETLSATDFVPFESLSDLPMGMVAHVAFEGLAETGPATTSPAIIRLIREQIGFDGLLMTDDISMAALSGSTAQRVRAALDAGVDIVLHCNGDPDEMLAIATEADTLSGLARQRAERALDMRESPDLVNIDTLEAELRDLRKEGANGRGRIAL